MEDVNIIWMERGKIMKWTEQHFVENKKKVEIV